LAGVGNQPRESWFLSWLVGFLVGFFDQFQKRKNESFIFQRLRNRLFFLTRAYFSVKAMLVSKNEAGPLIPEKKNFSFLISKKKKREFNFSEIKGPAFF
jgi:hypothetical protein